ncbi:MAG: hypothetical protein ABSC08_11620 [Bryobacteraceae bacterium]|jgi:hypothetical protein
MIEVGLSASSLVVVLFFLVVPLAAYLWRRGQRPGRLALSCFAITVLWYVSQSTIHEASHVLGIVASGAPATSFRVIPYSWEGFFAQSFEAPGVTGTHWQRLIQLAAPFLVDGLLMLLGSWVFQWRHDFPPLVGGLILTLTYLRSVFDLVNNYMAGVLAGTGDYQQLLSGYPPLAIHACTLALILLGLLGTWAEIGRARRTDG